MSFAAERKKRPRDRALNDKRRKQQDGERMAQEKKVKILSTLGKREGTHSISIALKTFRGTFRGSRARRWGFFTPPVAGAA